MNSSIKLGSIRGIEIGVHFTWLIVFGLVTTSLAQSFFPTVVPGLGSINYWILGAVSTVLLFASVLVHELSHSFVAQHYGMRVKSITLFVFGGVSNIQDEPKAPRDEALMAAAGPLSSFAIGGVLFLIWIMTTGLDSQITAVLLYLSSVNLLLGAFNLVPGFPLDGGRVARAILWAKTGSLERATKIASELGRLIAYLFIFIGLFNAFTGNIVGGIWLIFIGWFLNNAAEQSYRQVAFQTRFHGIKVGDVMDPQPVVVEPRLPLQKLIDEYVLERNLRAFPVIDAGALVGMVTLSDVRPIPRGQWAVATVDSVMTGADRLKTIRIQDGLAMALQLLAEGDVNQLPVVEGNRLAGLLSRSHVIRFLQVREELGIESQRVAKMIPAGKERSW